MINFKQPGRMISATKSSPKGHVCIFNANVCSNSRGKFWYGDIDLTADINELRKLAREEGEEIFILREMDARFEHEANSKLNKAVAIVRPDGTITCYDPRWKE